VILVVDFGGWLYHLLIFSDLLEVYCASKDAVHLSMLCF